jgi:hypothetical protein
MHVRRGTFRSVVDLQAAINRYVAEHNTEPKPFVRTADPDRVLAASKRGNRTLEATQQVPTACRRSPSLSKASGRSRRAWTCVPPRGFRFGFAPASPHQPSRAPQRRALRSRS